MYELEGFGARLQQLRKKKGMTQEDLALRVGVTGQAVSKWETDQSYPDITLITTLATILEADIHYMFGKKEVAPVTNNNFPEMLGNLPLVHSAQGVACYSNKEVLSVDTTGVKFADGSTAELSNKLVINMGAGEVKFAGNNNELSDWQHIDHSITSQNFEFGFIENLDLTFNSGHIECRILPSQDGKTRVMASGGAVFIHTLKVEVADSNLKISQKPAENYGGHGRNEITIEMPCDVGGIAVIKINGSSNITSEIAKFNTGNLVINGSGLIKMLEFGECSAKINGSGEIAGTHAGELNVSINGSGVVAWGTCDKSKVSINGSGDIKLDSAVEMDVRINGSGVMGVGEMAGGGDFSSKIHGSGYIRLKSGSCNKFGADVFGHGDIDAAGLTTREADIVLHNDGNVTLGRVLEYSREQIKKKGTIQVLKRGNEN